MKNFKFKPIFFVSSPPLNGIVHQPSLNPYHLVVLMMIKRKGLCVIQLKIILKRKKRRCKNEHTNSKMFEPFKYHGKNW
jgi:hypothetical protein